MDYARKLWAHISLIATENDSIITFRLLDVLIELGKGNPDVIPTELYSLMCKEFTTLYE